MEAGENEKPHAGLFFLIFSCQFGFSAKNPFSRQGIVISFQLSAIS